MSVKIISRITIYTLLSERKWRTKYHVIMRVLQPTFELLCDGLSSLLPFISIACFEHIAISLIVIITPSSLYDIISSSAT